MREAYDVVNACAAKRKNHAVGSHIRPTTAVIASAGPSAACSGACRTGRRRLRSLQVHVARTMAWKTRRNSGAGVRWRRRSVLGGENPQSQRSIPRSTPATRVAPPSSTRLDFAVPRFRLAVTPSPTTALSMAVTVDNGRDASHLHRARHQPRRAFELFKCCLRRMHVSVRDGTERSPFRTRHPQAECRVIISPLTK